jgi:hypothetical protein
MGQQRLRLALAQKKRGGSKIVVGQHTFPQWTEPVKQIVSTLAFTSAAMAFASSKRVVRRRNVVMVRCVIFVDCEMEL